MNTILSAETSWLLEPEAFLRLCALPPLAAFPQNSPPAGAETPLYIIAGGLATVPLHGTIFRELSESSRRVLQAYGLPFTESAKVAAGLRELRDNPAVHAVLLDIDSPGGAVNGTPELAAAVRQLSREKFVYAFTPGLCCSAAYWVASQCDGIYAAPSARVGSIGVILPLLDNSEALSKNGLRVDVFSAGRYKSAGLAGTSLTDEQRELLQKQVNSTWADFKAAVTSRRRSVEDSCMEGQTFTGAEARGLHLVDACAYHLAEVQEKLLLRHC